MLNIAIFENQIENTKLIRKHLDNFKKSAESIKIKEFQDVDDFLDYLVNPVDIVCVMKTIKSLKASEQSDAFLLLSKYCFVVTWKKFYTIKQRITKSKKKVRNDIFLP